MLGVLVLPRYCSAVVCSVRSPQAHNDMSKGWEAALTALNVAFTVLYVGEMAFKWIAVGIHAYFRWAPCHCDFDAKSKCPDIN